MATKKIEEKNAVNLYNELAGSGAFGVKPQVSSFAEVQKMATANASPVGVISTAQGQDALNKAQATETKVSSPTPATSSTTTTTPDKPTTPKGSTFTFDDAVAIFGNDFSGLTKNEDGTYTPDSSALSRVGITGLDTSKNEEQAGKYKKERDSLISQLKNLNVSNDPNFKSQVDSISSGFDSRIADMKKINEYRKAAIRTTGIRTGSQFTGGDGGVFGSIITEEERQGVARVAELESMKQAAIAKARDAYEDRQFAKYSKFIELADSQYKEQLDEIENINKAQAEQNKKISEGVIQAKKDSAIAEFIDAGITNPLDIMSGLSKSGMSVTAKDIGEAIKNLTGATGSADKLTGDFANFYALKNIKGALPASITSLPTEGEQLGAFIKWHTQISSSKSGANVGNGKMTSTQFTQENIALSAIPVQLRNSETELNRYLEGIRLGLAEGKTPYEVSDELMGYKINKPDSFSDGIRPYLSVANLDGQQIQTVARLINSGRRSEAVSIIENNIYTQISQQEKGGFVSEADVTYVKEKTDEITKLLGEGWANEVGAFTGSFQSWLSKKFGYGEAVKIKAKVTNLAAELANKRGGSAITEEEWDRLIAPNIPAMNDNANTFKDKLKELVDDPLSRLNAERVQYQMPSLDTNTLIDKNKRASLYNLDNKSSVSNNPIDKEESNRKSLDSWLGKDKNRLKMIEDYYGADKVDSIPAEQVIKDFDIPRVEGWLDSKQYHFDSIPVPKDVDFKKVEQVADPELIAGSILAVETGGDYQAKGKSGEYGAYQFTPEAWNNWSKRYFGKVLPMTPSNQDKVALARINHLLEQGLNAREIALKWNSGSTTPKKGVNKFGVPYDSGAYAEKVLTQLSKAL
jgi:hypothetical protein